MKLLRKAKTGAWIDKTDFLDQAKVPPALATASSLLWRCPLSSTLSIDCQEGFRALFEGGPAPSDCNLLEGI